MAGSPPTVYILHGDDEFAIAQELAAMQARLGEAAGELNITRLDGQSVPLADLQAAANTIPFLTTRRMVVVQDGLTRFKSKEDRNTLIELLENLPESTALVFQESKTLSEDNWLLRWATGAGGQAFARRYAQVRGGPMADWIRQQARAASGEFSPAAAHALSHLVGTDKRHAAQEIEKLLAYVNYQRPVEADDVQYLAIPADQQEDNLVFGMVDAIGLQDTRTALDLLHQLLLFRDPLSLFGMVVRQFRLLLLSREILDSGGGPTDIREAVQVPPFVARKLVGQARNFDRAALEAIYRRLLDLDFQIKTGQIEATTGLDTLIASLSPNFHLTSR